MNVLQKVQWVRLKLQLGNKFEVPFKGTFLGNMKVNVTGSGKLKLGYGFSCRDNVLFHLSGGCVVVGDNTFLNDGCKLNSRKKLSLAVAA